MCKSLKGNSLFLALILINLTSKSFSQQSESIELEGKRLINFGHEKFRIITDSIFGGQLIIEAEVDPNFKTLQFKRFISGTIFRRKLNSSSFGYDINYNKKVPQQFEMIKPEIEKDLKLIKFEIDKALLYEKTYEFYIKLK